MKNSLVALAVAAFVASVSPAFAQEGRGSQKGAQRMELSAIPAGGALFTKVTSGTETDLRNYAVGGAFTYNFNRFTAVEGEGGVGLGINHVFSYTTTSQVPALDGTGNPVLDDQGNPIMTPVTSTIYHTAKSPRTLAYTGNFVYSPAGNNHIWVPYVTGGMGGLTIFARADLSNEGLTSDVTYLTANVGGGLKGFVAGRWGFRVDYRLIMVKQQDSAPGFFAQAVNRYGHRVYASVVYTFGR